jgi:hypothetical protein
MRWCKDLIVGESYFVVGFVDRNLTIPSISTFVYLGYGALGVESAGQYCFQDAQSAITDIEDANEQSEKNYIALAEESLDQIADKLGLINWLQSEHSASRPV